MEKKDIKNYWLAYLHRDFSIEYKKYLLSYEIQRKQASSLHDDNLYMNINYSYSLHMFFLSTPQAWHLVGTWSEQLPNESNLIGMNQLELMMTLHFIFVPILSIIALYYFLKISKEEVKKVKG